MKPTTEQFKTAECLVDTVLETIHQWKFITKSGIQAEMKFIQRLRQGQYVNWWCAYLTLTEEHLTRAGAEILDSETIILVCPHIHDEVTYSQQLENGLYVIGWDYSHYRDIEDGETGTYEEVKESLELTSKWIMERVSKPTLEDLKIENQELKDHCKRLQDLLNRFHYAVTQTSEICADTHYMKNETFRLTASDEQKEDKKKRDLKHIEKAKEFTND